jgi:hypothetical protein
LIKYRHDDNNQEISVKSSRFIILDVFFENFFIVKRLFEIDPSAIVLKKIIGALETPSRKLFIHHEPFRAHLPSPVGEACGEPVEPEDGSLRSLPSKAALETPLADWY